MYQTLAKNLLFTMTYRPDFLVDYAKEAPHADLRISNVTILGNPNPISLLFKQPNVMRAFIHISISSVGMLDDRSYPATYETTTIN